MIIRNHKAEPLVLTEAQKASLRGKGRHSSGLGDKVEKIAKPIAKAIDKIARTDIQNCRGCQERKEWLNKHFP